MLYCLSSSFDPLKVNPPHMSSSSHRASACLGGWEVRFEELLGCHLTQESSSHWACHTRTDPPTISQHAIRESNLKQSQKLNSYLSIQHTFRVVNEKYSYVEWHCVSSPVLWHVWLCPLTTSWDEKVRTESDDTDNALNWSDEEENRNLVKLKLSFIGIMLTFVLKTICNIWSIRTTGIISTVILGLSPSLIISNFW